MGRVLLTIPENASDFLKVGSSFRVEFFRLSTYCTSGSTSATVPVAELSGFAAGDHVYVGTNDSAIIQSVSASAGAGNIVVPSSITFANNDSVLLKRDVSADNANDDYADVYDDPDFQTAYTGGQPISVDSDNQIFAFLTPGRYGMRWSTTNATLETHHQISFDELDWVQVTPGANSPTAGIEEAIRLLPSTGGTVYIPPGTYTITEQIDISTSNVRIIGAGQGVSIVKQDASAGLGGMFVIADGTDRVEFAYLQVDGNAANNNTASTVCISANGACDDIYIHNCWIRNAPKDGISIGTTTASSQSLRTRVQDNRLTNIGWQGIVLTFCREFFVIGNSINATGFHCIEFGPGDSPATEISQRGIVANNNVTRATAPTDVLTGQTESGFMIAIGDNSEDVLIQGNYLFGNQQRGGAITAGDGIGVGMATGREHERISIIGNVVKFASAFGIDLPANSICVGNIIVNAADHGIVVPFDALQNTESILIADNIIEDANEDASGSGIAGIHVDLTGTASSTVESLTIRGNQVRTPNNTVHHGILLGTSATESIGTLIIEGNDLKDAATSSISWTGTNFTSIRVRNNVMNDAYSGEATLALGTKAVQNTNWPAIAGLKFNVSRTSYGSTGAAAVGILRGAYDGTDTLNINAVDVANSTANQTTDKSTVFWEFLGTAT